MNKGKNNSPIQSEDEIDLISLAKTLWEGRKIVIKTTIVFMVVGLLIAIFSEKEYTSSCTIVPQSSEGGSKLGGSLGGLAAMAGINLGSMSGGSIISPTLYPKIIKSIPFQKDLMETQLTIDGYETPVTFAEYYLNVKKNSPLSFIKKYTIGLPGVVLSMVRGKSQDESDLAIGDSLISITHDERQLIDILSSQLSLDINDKDGYISISARMPESKAACQLVQKAQELLQNSITNFKIQKAKEQLRFVKKRFDEKKLEVEYIQKRLANFRDRNKNVSTAKAKTEQERLNAEYNLVYGVYSELAKQLETQKIKVKENTPVFTVIEPATVPLLKSKPKRSIILMIWSFFGCIIGVCFVFGNEFLGELKKKWNINKLNKQC